MLRQAYFLQCSMQYEYRIGLVYRFYVHLDARIFNIKPEHCVKYYLT